MNALIDDLHVVEGYLGLSHYRDERLTDEEMANGHRVLDAARAAIAAMDLPIKPRVRHRPTGVFSGDYYAITYDDCECQGWDMVLVHSCDGEPREGGQTLVARQNHLRACPKYPHPTPDPDMCALCGRPTKGHATYQSSNGPELHLCHSDGRDCYRRWIQGERPTPEPDAAEVARELARQVGTHHLDRFEHGDSQLSAWYMRKAEGVMALFPSQPVGNPDTLPTVEAVARVAYRVGYENGIPASLANLPAYREIAAAIVALFPSALYPHPTPEPDAEVTRSGLLVAIADADVSPRQDGSRVLNHGEVVVVAMAVGSYLKAAGIKVQP